MDKGQTWEARRQRGREYRVLLVNSREQLQVKYRGGYVPHMSFLLFLAHFTNTRERSRRDGQTCGCVLIQCFSTSSRNLASWLYWLFKKEKKLANIEYTVSENKTTDRNSARHFHVGRYSCIEWMFSGKLLGKASQERRWKLAAKIRKECTIFSRKYPNDRSTRFLYVVSAFVKRWSREAQGMDQKASTEGHECALSFWSTSTFLHVLVSFVTLNARLFCTRTAQFSIPG